MSFPDRHSQIAALGRWRPLWIAAVLALVVLGWPAARWLIDRPHFTPGGLAIETAGASGEIAGGQWHLTLPVAVFNGSDRAVSALAIDVQAFACPADDSPVADCRRIATLTQGTPRLIPPGESARFTDRLSGDAPAGLPAGVVRINRRVESVSNGSEDSLGLRDDPGRIDGPIDRNQHY